MSIRWHRKYHYTAREGTWAGEWPDNAVLKHYDVLEYFDNYTDSWQEVPVFIGDKPERPTRY